MSAIKPTIFDTLKVTYYHFRIHIKDVSLNELVSWIKDNSNLVLIVREEASRSHVHCALYMKTLGLSRFRQNFVSAFPALKGNGSYSLKVVRKTIHDMLQYLCKGQHEGDYPNVVDYGMLTSDNVLWYHYEYWKQNNELCKIVEDVIQETTQKVKVKKTRTKTWSEKTFDELMLMEHEIDMVRTYELLTKPTDYERVEYLKAKRALFGHVMKCLGKSVKKLNDNIIKDLWNGFYNSIVHTDEEASSKYVDKLYARLGI